MLDKQIEKTINAIMDMIEDDWTEIKFFYALNKSSSSFIYYLKNGEREYRRNENANLENLEKNIKYVF